MINLALSSSHTTQRTLVLGGFSKYVEVRSFWHAESHCWLTLPVRWENTSLPLTGRLPGPHSPPRFIWSCWYLPVLCIAFTTIKKNSLRLEIWPFPKVGINHLQTVLWSLLTSWHLSMAGPPMVSFSPFIWTCQIYPGLYGWNLGVSFHCRITPDLRPYIWFLFVKSILCRKLPLRTASQIPNCSGHPCLRLTIPLHQGSFGTWF